MGVAIEQRTDEALAMQYLTDLLYGALLKAGEPVKASEAARLVGRSDIDLRLARVVLVTGSSKFTATDRKWTLWSRFADPSRTLVRSIEEALQAYGLPMQARSLAREMAQVFRRPVEVYEETLPRLLADGSRFFRCGVDAHGLRRWLLETQGANEDDILFDNYLTETDIAMVAGLTGPVDAHDVDAVVAALDKAAEPVSSKVLQFLAYRAAPVRFHAETFFTGLYADGRAVYLSDGTWIGPALAARSATSFHAIAEREVEEGSDLRAADASQPLVVTDEEREQLVGYVQRNESTSHAGRMIEDIFEISPSDPTYVADLQSITDVLKADDRVMWVGTDRFLPDGAAPPYIHSVPEILSFPEMHFLDAEGNEVDLLLADEGFDGGLDRAIASPLAQDVGDEEPVGEIDPIPPTTARCVLKYHHKEVGTYPQAQLPPGFFPAEPRIVQVEITVPNGHRYQVWVNNETRMLYGLLDWYLTLPIDSGAVFYLERAAPDRFLLTSSEETEPAMFISRNRINELLELGQRAETDEIPTFDIVREILEHYRKGIDYITILTETGIARRTMRRMVASLLSEYHCFFQRGGTWVYDARKLSQGFDKSKRKYLKR